MTSPRRHPGAGWRCSATCSSWDPLLPHLHREIGAQAREAGIDLLVTVGALAAEIAAGFGGVSRSLPDAQAAAAELPGLIERGDTVLVKASRGIGLERVSEALRRSTAGGGSAPGLTAVASPPVPGQR